jgi:hypothetical protein
VRADGSPIGGLERNLLVIVENSDFHREFSFFLRQRTDHQGKRP